LLSVGDALEAQARQGPDRVAAVCGDQRLTFSEIEGRANAAARLLWREGVRPGDRVATLLPSGLTMLELLFAAARTGAVLCPVNVRLQADEVAYQLHDASPRLLVAAPSLAAAFGDRLPAELPLLLDGPPTGVAGDAGQGYAERRNAEERSPFPPRVGEEAPWLLVYTSGTTGRPKGALRTQRGDFLVGLMLANAVGVGPEDTGLAILPMFHVNSIWFATLSLCMGAACHIYAAPQFHPAAIGEALERSEATYAMFVPTLLGYLADLLEAGRVRTPSLRVVMTSSAPLPAALRDRLLRALPTARLFEVYGATELGPVTLARHTGDTAAGTVGFPLPGVRVRLLDDRRRPVAPGEVGELFAGGPLLMSGYFGRPEDTEAALDGGFLSVGDLARQAPDGSLSLVDRAADTIITSGENVYPTEVEGVLAAHPAVRLAAVFGADDPRRGQRVVAVVVQRPGAPAAPQELAAHCRRWLADYKCPRVFAFADDLPLGPTGKVLRRRARDLWQQGGFRTRPGD
jgi:acyl-CoA synthetase (AMP-forming)/AMP-acid ligase II